jgi:hypothetical protein
MAKDNKTAIAEAKNALRSLEKDYQELSLINDDKEKELQETIQKQRVIEGVMKDILIKLNRINRETSFTQLKLNKLEIKQHAFDRKKKFNEMLTQYPNFLDIVEDKLSELEAKQQEGKRLPNEIKIESLNQIAKLKELEQLDYLKRCGMTDKYQVYSNIKLAYNNEVQRDIENTFNNGSFSKSYEDFEYLAVNLLNNKFIRSYLSR